MARPTSIRDFQAAQRGGADLDDLPTNGHDQAGETADAEPIEPRAEDRADDGITATVTNDATGETVTLEQAQANAARPHEYDVAPDGTVKDWRVYAPRPNAVPTDGEDDEPRFSGAGAGPEPTADNAQQASLFLVPEDAAFNGAQFRAAPELANIADRLIDEHGFLRELINCKITYLWKRKTGVSKGKLKIGFLARGSGLLGHFSRVDFLVWLSASTARDAKFTDRQVEAAVMHQLLHISEDDNGNWIKVAHDFEGFAAEVRAYGTWTEDLRLGATSFKIARQLGLDLDATAEDDQDDEDDEDEEDPNDGEDEADADLEDRADAALAEQPE